MSSKVSSPLAKTQSFGNGDILKDPMLIDIVDDLKFMEETDNVLFDFNSLAFRPFILSGAKDEKSFWAMYGKLGVLRETPRADPVATSLASMEPTTNTPKVSAGRGHGKDYKQ